MEAIRGVLQHPQTQLLFCSPFLGFPKDLGRRDRRGSPIMLSSEPNYKVQNVQGPGGCGGLELSEGEECLLLSGRKIDLE